MLRFAWYPGCLHARAGGQVSGSLRPYRLLMTSYLSVDDPRYSLYADAMSRALQLAAESPDPSTQNGAVVLTGELIAAGDCNRFPAGVNVTDGRLQRPLKYSFIEHAERGALFQAARAGVRLEDATLVCPWAACADCARAIVQCGIATLIRLPRVDGGPSANFKASVAAGDQILAEGGVAMVELDPRDVTAPPVLRNGRPWTVAELALAAA